MFRDRTDAGRRLARKLEKYRGTGALVLAIPRGGVEVGYQVARHLEADFSIIVTRKLPFPDNPESGFGAIAEDGSVFMMEAARYQLSDTAIERIAQEQRREVRRRIEVLRGGRPLPDVEGRTVILVDDGIAMGSTMGASIMLLRNRKAGRVVAAAPVTGARTASEVGKLADEVVVVETPAHFYAVAQVYENWYDVPDEEVVEIMERWERERRGL
ncbi:MAG: phosphoribosyltransferase family protein [Nitrospirota bacterium]|jgi:putative phosphoribosyl transferase